MKAKIYEVFNGSEHIRTRVITANSCMYSNSILSFGPDYIHVNKNGLNSCFMNNSDFYGDSPIKKAKAYDKRKGLIAVLVATIDI